jgi:hypothetical protein
MPDRFHLRVQFVALTHDLAGAVGVAPEIGRFGAGCQVVEACFCCIPVKDASSAGSAPARFRPPIFRFQHASAKHLFRSGVHVEDAGARINLPRG